MWRLACRQQPQLLEAGEARPSDNVAGGEEPSSWMRSDVRMKSARWPDLDLCDTADQLDAGEGQAWTTTEPLSVRRPFAQLYHRCSLSVPPGPMEGPPFASAKGSSSCGRAPSAADGAAVVWRSAQNGRGRLSADGAEDDDTAYSPLSSADVECSSPFGHVRRSADGADDGLH
jgi:hypothetical protein